MSDPSKPTHAFDMGDIATVQSFVGPTGLTARIAALENRLVGLERGDALRVLGTEAVDASALAAAVAVKRMAGQINVIVHAIGIVTALPYVLQPGEVVQGLSLGAGNTGRAHDLETDRKVAEFKFIEWQGGPESIRQNALFVDIFGLASDATDKRKVMYIVGSAYPMKFLTNNRALSSVLSKNEAVARRFREAHGDRFRTVSEYWATVAASIDIIDLADVVPTWRELSSS